MAEKHRLDHLREATTQELLEEEKRRRKQALSDCSDDEIAEEIAKRPGMDRDAPPKIVEK